MSNFVNNATNQDAVLQTYNDRKLVNIVDLQRPVWKKLKAAARTVTVNQKGREKVVTSSVRTQIKMGASNMDYPAGTAYKRGRMRVVPIDQVVTYEIDRATYQDYRNGKAETLSSMAEEMDLLAEAFGRQKEFFLAGDGSAKLGTIASGSTTTVINLDTVPNGTPGKAYGASQLESTPVAYDIYTAAGAVHASNVEIAEDGINYSANSVTLTAALGLAPAAGAFFVPAGSYNSAARGFAYLFAGGKTGWWQAVNVTNKREYQTPYVDALGGGVGNSVIEKLLQKHAFRNGTGLNAAFKIFSSPSLISLYKSPGWNMFRFASKDDTYNTAFKNARYEDSIFEPFPQCDPDAMYGVDMSDVVHIEQTPVGPFRGADGLLFHQKTGSNGTGKGEFYMQYGCSDNLAIDQPQKHIVARNFDLTGAATIYNYTSSN